MPELYALWTGAGKRVFDVEVEGVVPSVFNDIDPYGIGGAKGAFVLTHTLTVQDGSLDFAFLHITDNPALKGIEIVTLGAGGSDPNAYVNYAQVLTSGQTDPDSVPGDNSVGSDDDTTLTLNVGGPAPADPVVSIVNGPITVSEAAGTAQVLIETDVPVPSGESVTVNFAILPGTAVATGDSLGDYEYLPGSFNPSTSTYSGSVVIGGGSSTANFLINITDDSEVESNEAFTVNITGVSSNAQLGTDSASVTIQDNDTAGTTVIEFWGDYITNVQEDKSKGDRRYRNSFGTAELGLDLDGDGASDDSRVTYPFSLTDELNPQQFSDIWPTFEYQVDRPGAVFYGGYFGTLLEPTEGSHSPSLCSVRRGGLQPTLGSRPAVAEVLRPTQTIRIR